MKYMTIDEIIQKAKEKGSYLLTLTTRDKNKTENNLNHYFIQKDWNRDDIIPSLDECVRTLGVDLEKPVDVIIPEKSDDNRKKLRIAIISHFNSMPESYSPARAVKNQIKILKEHGHDVTFFLNEKSKLTEEQLGCKILTIIPAFKREKMVINEEVKNKLISIFREHLTSDFDVAITHDFFIQDTITFSEAIRECGVTIPWLHFCRSGVAHNMDFSMPNAKFVYLNYADVGRFAKAIKVSVDQCRTVFNEKDPQYMYNWHPITRMIVNKYRLWEKDIIQVYPICSTRFESKGINSVIKAFVELKRLGNKVTLIIANSNGRRRVDDLGRKIKMAEDLGLNKDEFIITSLLADEEYKIESELPNQVCAELMQIANLFIFPTVAEVGPNILLEAAIAKNLIVVNADLPLLYDFVDKENTLSYPFTSNQRLHFKERDGDSYNKLAKKINGELKSNKADLTFRKVWRSHNAESIYDMLSGVLYEDIKI